MHLCCALRRCDCYVFTDKHQLTVEWPRDNGKAVFLHAMLAYEGVEFFPSFFLLLALQPLLGIVFYNPLVGFSLLAYEVS